VCNSQKWEEPGARYAIGLRCNSWSSLSAFVINEDTTPFVVMSTRVSALQLMLDGLINPFISNFKRVKRLWHDLDSFMEQILLSIKSSRCILSDSTLNPWRWGCFLLMMYEARSNWYDTLAFFCAICSIFISCFAIATPRMKFWCDGLARVTEVVNYDCAA
jgi:hypothetical protein